MDLKIIPQFKNNPTEALAHYKEYGFSIEYDVWTAEECSDLRCAAAASANYDPKTQRPLMQMHLESASFLRALRNPQIVSIMELLVGGEVSGLQTEFFFCKPGTRGFAKHQDNQYLDAKMHKFASAWSAMEHVDEANGALTIYPRSHIAGLFEIRDNPDFVEDRGQDPNAYRRELILPEEFKKDAVVATLPRGAVLLIHGHLVHSSLQNKSPERSRNALLMTYIYRGEKFRAGNHAKRQEIDVYSEI